jgi:hypothetical protein
MPAVRHKRSQNAGVVYVLVEDEAALDGLMRISSQPNAPVAMGLPELGVKSYVQSKDKSMKAGHESEHSGISRGYRPFGSLAPRVCVRSLVFMPASGPLKDDHEPGDLDKVDTSCAGQLVNRRNGPFVDCRDKVRHIPLAGLNDGQVRIHGQIR